MIEKLITGAFILLVVGGCLSEAQDFNFTEHPGELCNSKCVTGQNRVCYFEWTLELYHAMGPACGECENGVFSDCSNPQCIVGDGFQKGVMSINRMIPGPAINVCEGDRVVVDVKNMASGTAASIHWHGLHMVDTPYMDGVPHVTQCPIIFESTFRYQFYATEPGTHFYHSHSGHHKLNGQYGPLVIRQSDENNPHINNYDYDLSEHYILISDWKHGYAENFFPGLPKGESFADSLLINGRGSYVDKDTLEHNQVPVSVFYVNPGARYKFNLIDAMSLGDIAQIQIENHTMVVLATDSFNVEPLEIDTLLMNAGERYDVVINASKPSGDYWIRIRGAAKNAVQPTDSFALLRYITTDSDYNKPQPPFPSYNETFPIGNRLNHPQASCFYHDTEYCVTDLTALEKDRDLVTSKPDYRFVFPYQNNAIPVEKAFIPGKYKRFENARANHIANGIMNNISIIFPPQPVLTQYSDVDTSLFCDSSECPEKCNGESTRECVHLVKVKTNSIVEMALHDEANIPGLDHPFHLHGHRFALMGISNNTTDLEKALHYARKYKKRRPVWKDTVSIPRNGLAVARFRASNPGIWLLHCHYELHLATGMALLFQVGEPDEWVQVPNDFPKCGNYMPVLGN